MVSLEFKDFRTFLDAFSANVSRSGMFLEADEPEAPGSEIDFELGLAGGEPLLKGRGEVAWVSGNEDSETPGMGVRFLDLDADSEKLVERIEEIRTKSGRKIFDLDHGAQPEGAIVESEDAATDSAPAESDSESEPSTDDQAQLEERVRLIADLDTVRAERDKLAERLSTLEEVAGDGSELDTLRGETEALRKELEELRAEEEKNEKLVEEQAADIARFTEQGKYAMAERNRLESAKKAVAEELEGARAEVAQLEEGRAEIDKAADQVKEVEETLAESQAAEAKLREELVEVRSDAEKLKDEARADEAQLRSELKELEENQATLNASLEGGQSALDDVRLQFEESAGRVLELEHEASSLGTQLSEAQELIDKLDSESAEARTEAGNLRAERDTMKSELAVQKMVAKRAKRLSDRVREEHMKLQEDLAEVQATLEEIQEERGEGEHVMDGPDPQYSDEPPVDETEVEVEVSAGVADDEVSEEEFSADEKKPGLWAAIAKPLGKLLGEAHEDEDEGAMYFDEDSPEEGAAESEPGAEDFSDDPEDSEGSDVRAAAGGG